MQQQQQQQQEEQAHQHSLLPPQQQPVARKQRQPQCDSYRVWFRDMTASFTPVEYVHVLGRVPELSAAATGSAAAASQGKQHVPPARELGVGGFAVVYLLEQKVQSRSRYPRLVALKVPYVGREHSCDDEQRVLTHLRDDLPNVVALLGTAIGSSGGQVVRGLVYEYCPDGNSVQWTQGLLRRAAQDPEMKQQYPAAASILLAMLTDFTDWRCPKELLPQCLALTNSDIPAFHAQLAAPLRQRVLEQVLKKHMGQLLHLLVQMSGSTNSGPGTNSSSSGAIEHITEGVASSATVPPGGFVIHGDIKPVNLLAAAGHFKLADWGVAVYFPGSWRGLLGPQGHTVR
jgi:serine/threonine protein kinase